MKNFLNRYKRRFPQNPLSVKKSLPFVISSFLLFAFGVSLCLEYAVQWAMKGSFWHGLLLIAFAVFFVWSGQILLHLFVKSGPLAPKTEPAVPPKSVKSDLSFPFDVLAGHHCAVVVGFDSDLPKTYLIPNVGAAKPLVAAESEMTDVAVVEKTVGQLRRKGFPIQVLKPAKPSMNGYSPLLGNPKRDTVRIHPFDMIFVNWN
jgi:hypothetical protein